MRSLNPLQLLPLPLLRNHNIRLLFLQRFIRLAAYGSSTLILAQFFSALHHPTSLTGLFMTLTLYGDVLISLLLTLFADRLGRRKILLLGAALMALSGVIFATASSFWILLFAAIVGVISPAGNEIGPFKAIEESVTAQIVDAAGRTEVFAWYTLVGALGSALGSVVCGWVVWWMMDGGAEAERAYRVIFWAYAVMGVLKMGLAWALTEECEVGGGDSSQGAERERLVEEGGKERRWKVLKILLPEMSKESLSVLWKLCLLFSIDSLASGLAAPSWMTYYFTTKHSLPSSTLGTLFLFTSLASASSSLLAVPIAARLGLIRTMVYTHLPAAVILVLIPLPPGTHTGTAVAMSFLVVRSLMASMDQAPRTAFLAAIMLPRERTAVMGVVNTVKTFSQAAGPAVTGWAGERGAMGAAFSVAGCLKVMYDLGLLAWFLRGGLEGRGGDGYSVVKGEEEDNEMLDIEASESEEGEAGHR